MALISLSGAELRRIRDMSLAGMSASAIARDMRRHSDTIQAAVRKLRAVGELPPKGRLIDSVPPRVARLISAQAGRRVKNSLLAAQLGCTVEQVAIVRKPRKAERMKDHQKSYHERLRQGAVEQAEADNGDAFLSALNRSLPPLTSHDPGDRFRSIRRAA